MENSRCIVQSTKHSLEGKIPMRKVLIKCPHTGRPVYTGKKLPEVFLASEDVRIGRHQFRCPECSELHTWDDQNAYAASDEEAFQ